MFWKILQGPFLFLLVATLLEATGDALVRMSIYREQLGWARVAIFLLGAALLTGYGTFLNLAPLEFARVVGLYIATLFVVWQVINYLAFGVAPGAPIFVGGALIVTGGMIVSYWKP